VRAVTDGRPGRGFTLVELLVGLVLGGVVLAGAYGVLLSSQRFYRAQAAILEVHQGVRAAVQVLVAELRDLDPGGGDIVAIGPDSISIHAPRRLAFVCANPRTGGRLVVRDTLSYGFRAVDPARDRALVLCDGGAAAAEPGWLDVAVTSATAGARCDDGAAGTALVVAAPPGALDSVPDGSPVRTYEREVYRLYADDGGSWWLGERAFTDGGWAAISPVAGPLQARTGVRFAYLDSAGTPTADPRAVARISIAIRGLSSAPVPGSGGHQVRFADSLLTVVRPRNGRAAAP
jgi:prepilin-type N-terminal cleavage/methylation domain-containing protein